MMNAGISGTTKGRRLRTMPLLAQVGWPSLAVVVLVLLWEAVSRGGLVDETTVPPASEVAKALWDLGGESYFWSATRITVQETLAGFFAGVIAAWILGTLIGVSTRFRLAFYPLIVAFQIMPRIALAPLFLTWFGFGITSKIVMAATICFFPVLIGVIVGMNTVDADARTLMRSLGASRWETYRKLSLPSSLPVIFAGIKTAMTLALIGAVVGEFVGASEGMGVLVETFNQQLQVAEGFAVILALSAVGLVLYALTELAERKLIFWAGH
ncbi:MAG: ABC transporter permease [Nocardioides sp.]|uniref:ABC transporter permease n=1 Tax=Nocardioides sp. TaxID=35761 RepID=UPI0039E6B9FD